MVWARRRQVPVFSLGTDVKPADIAAAGVAAAVEQSCDTVIIDTAGRTQIDEDMMTELKQARRRAARGASGCPALSRGTGLCSPVLAGKGAALQRRDSAAETGGH